MMFRRSYIPLFLSLLPVALYFSLFSVVEVAGEPLAEVDGVAISSEEVEKALGAQFTKSRQPSAVSFGREKGVRNRF
jgi:hypothetical protein